MTPRVLTDAAIRRALEPPVHALPPVDFTRRVADAIAVQPRRRAFPNLLPPAWRRPARQLVQAIILALLLVVLALGAILLAGAPNRPVGNGSVVVLREGELLSVDDETGNVATLVAAGDGVSAVSRSPDGGLVSFWSGAGSDERLELIRSDGTGRRPLALDMPPGVRGMGGVNVWSHDQRFLAADVEESGIRRILVVEIGSGDSWLIGSEAGARAPLWSPDGEWVAFRHGHSGGPGVLAVMRRDGSDVRHISGDLGGRDVSGANNWSPDSRWVYFDAGGHIYRANVERGHSERLTASGRNAAPALSPDGRKVTYATWPRGFDQPPDLHLMNADGGAPRVLLRGAINNGWSGDGKHVLAEHHRDGEPAALVTISVENGVVTTLLTADVPCSMPCFGGPSWGQPRP